MPNRRQAIIWTNADPFHWRIYAALWGDELNRWETPPTVRVSKISGPHYLKYQAVAPFSNMLPLPLNCIAYRRKHNIGVAGCRDLINIMSYDLLTGHAQQHRFKGIIANNAQVFFLSPTSPIDKVNRGRIYDPLYVSRISKIYLGRGYGSWWPGSLCYKVWVKSLVHSQTSTSSLEG